MLGDRLPGDCAHGRVPTARQTGTRPLKTLARRGEDPIGPWHQRSSGLRVHFGNDSRRSLDAKHTDIHGLPAAFCWSPDSFLYTGVVD